MRITRISLLSAIALLLLGGQAQAQSCLNYYKQAKSLKASKNYAEAITYYERAKSCDANLTKDCNKWISWCKERLKFDVSENTITIPWQGGDKQVDVTTYGKWTAECSDKWLKTVKLDEFGVESFVVQCREANNDLRDKISNIIVNSGEAKKIIKVIQEGRPEYIEAGATTLTIPSRGSDDNIRIESNANWDVVEEPSWCKIEKRENGIHIIVGKNDRIMDRNGDIVIKSPTKSITITIRQDAGEEHLSLSQNNLTFNKDGDTHYVKVYSDSANWTLGDFPSWLNAQRLGKDSIMIWAGKNLPNGETRSGSVQVRTSTQTIGLAVVQSPRYIQDVINPDSTVVNGRNFSIGVSASYYFPFVSTSAGGSYKASVMDYTLGNSSENASYKSATGFSFGIFADMRLYRNIFLIAGVNFSQIKYKNSFNEDCNLTVPYTKGRFLAGTVNNSYKEDYTHTMIEIPILASYRFKINSVSHVQINLGPVLNFGLSSKMKLSGNSDSETMNMYDSQTNRQVDNGTYVWHTSTNANFNLYKNRNKYTHMYTYDTDASVDKEVIGKGALLKKFNCGLRVGAAYEWAGLSFGIYYTYMLTNMANSKYWDNERWTIFENQSASSMKGYKQRINTLEFKVAYTLRYLKFKK